MSDNDTIAAISTPIGEGAIGIVRVSGSNVNDIIKKVFVRKCKSNLDIIPHKAISGYLLDPQTLERIDESIIIFMPGPNSYTSEDLVEIHCHGGIFLVKKILNILLLEGARLATPGEFTKRAFLNGRIDLAQAESVIDIIKADSDASLKSAVTNLSGGLSLKIDEINNLLIDTAASLEASIDFPDEDLDLKTYEAVKERIGLCINIMDELIDVFFKGRIVREGVKIAISGRPNVGKSSLINALLMENRVIVSPYPGTTRDVIEESISIDGIKFSIKDTAGLRDVSEKVEEEGIRRAVKAAHDADLILFVLDASEGIRKEDVESFNQIDNSNIIVILNKIDIGTKISADEIFKNFNTKSVVNISAVNGTGIIRLKESIKKRYFDGDFNLTEGILVTNLRHQDLLVKSRDALKASVKSIEDGLSEEFVCLEVNAALEFIEEVTGKRVSEDILDKIFSEFCIGK